MPADYAHRLTERAVSAMEKRIRDIYREARDELDRTVKEYFESFEKRDKEMRELIGSEINGRIWTEDDYKQWRLNQIGRGKRFEALRDEMAARYSDANELAIAYVNGKKPGIYAENRNYSAYTIEMSGANVSFTLFDESTVRRLIVEEPDLMPYYPPDKAHRRGIDLEWGKKQITKSVTSGILQGKSVGKIADDLQSRMEDMNRTSAIRTARTSATAAQNAGRMDAYTYAKSLGLDVRKQWLAIIDGRTRHYHAYLDGKIVETDEPFKVDGHEIRYPGDPKAAGYLIYNCRCTLLPVTEYSDVKEKPDISYPEWKKQKQSSDFTSATNMEQAKQTLKDTVGFKSVEPSFDDIDEMLAVDAANQLQKLEHQFGVISQSSASICSVSYEDASAYVKANLTNPARQTLSLCPESYKKYADNVSEVRECIDLNLYMPADESNFSVYGVTHEYGHMLQNVLFQQRMEAYGFDRLKAEINPNAKTARDRLLPYWKIHDLVTTECYNDIIEIAKANNSSFSLADNISQYGETNKNEFFAEVFANSQLGAPNELGKAMNEWLVKKGLIKNAF